MNYSELLQLARFGVIFYNYQRVIIWRLRHYNYGIINGANESAPKLGAYPISKRVNEMKKLATHARQAFFLRYNTYT